MLAQFLNWWLIGGICAAIYLGVMYFALSIYGKRERRKRQPKQ